MAVGTDARELLRRLAVPPAGTTVWLASSSVGSYAHVVVAVDAPPSSELSIPVRLPLRSYEYVRVYVWSALSDEVLTRCSASYVNDWVPVPHGAVALPIDWVSEVTSPRRSYARPKTACVVPPPVFSTSWTGRLAPSYDTCAVLPTGRGTSPMTMRGRTDKSSSEAATPGEPYPWVSEQLRHAARAGTRSTTMKLTQGRGAAIHSGRYSGQARVSVSWKVEEVK